MIGNSHSTPPEDDEVEVSLFGPGYGESIVLHLGQQDWIIVDSCLDPTTKLPTALEYLRKIDIDPSQAVKLVVATHWHDDHIRGLGAVLDECTGAKFVCSAALRRVEFLELVNRYGKRPMMGSSGVKEFREILRILEDRRDSSRPHSAGPDFALEGTVLLRRHDGADMTEGLRCEVQALSPSSAAMTLFYHEIAANLTPVSGSTKRRIVSQRPNQVAVVLWITTGRQSVLLGSDLEDTSNPQTGWSVIVDSAIRSPGRASIFKVPHHGSVTAEYLAVWTDMLAGEPFAILTPFVSGRHNFPTQDDTTRICNRTPRAYATAPATPRSAKRPSGPVEKTIRETVRSMKRVHGSTGQIRLRRSIFDRNEEGWKVELFGSAQPLHKIHEA